MAGRQRKLNSNEMSDLSDWIARNGETYVKYEEWYRLKNLSCAAMPCDNAEHPDEKKFSPAYLPTWIQRRRKIVQAKRAMFQEEVRSASRLPKMRRIELLESSVDRIQSRIAEAQANEDDVLYLKLEDQLRRQLESLAKEMGEFNAKPDDAGKDPSALGQAMVRALESYQADKPQLEAPVEAEWTVLPTVQVPQEVS